MKAAKGCIEMWNQYLSGDVYGVVVETYDPLKNQIKNDAVWGFYGFKYAMQELKNISF